MYLSFICFHFFKSKKCFVSPGSSGCFRIIIFIFCSRAVVCKGGLRGKRRSLQHPVDRYPPNHPSPPPVNQKFDGQQNPAGSMQLARQGNVFVCNDQSIVFLSGVSKHLKRHQTADEFWRQMERSKLCPEHSRPRLKAFFFLKWSNFYKWVPCLFKPEPFRMFFSLKNAYASAI